MSGVVERPDHGSEVLCHCGGQMELIQQQILEDSVEQSYTCGECGEKILVVKDRSWKETLPG